VCSKTSALLLLDATRPLLLPCTKGTGEEQGMQARHTVCINYCSNEGQTQSFMLLCDY